MPARRWSVADKFRNNMRTKLRKILPLIAALMLGMVTAVFAHNPGGKPDPMNASLEKVKGAEFEQSFLQQMIQYHGSGIETAKLASDHTSRAELRQFAEKMISNNKRRSIR